MDNNRYEKVEKKENPFLKVLKIFGQYLKNLGYDFVISFKYNNMKLASILVAIPGVLLGFFLKWHAPVIRDIVFKQGALNGIDQFYKISFDYSGMVLFILMLFGILNVFTAFSMSKKKNLGSVVLSTICTSVIVICGILYIYAIIVFFEGYNLNQTAIAEKYQELISSGMTPDAATKAANEACQFIGISKNEPIAFNSNYIVSISSIIISMISSVVGCILGFINYDRTYEKADR